MAHIAIGNVDYYYEIHGSGAPLILIAGYTCDHTFWLPILEGLSTSFQVVLFDNRGVGRTKDNGDNLSNELMAADVIKLIDQLDLKRPSIVGQSMGGTIAQEIAASYPDKINKLCILTSSAKWRKATLRGQKSLLDMRRSNLDFDLIFDATIPWVFGEKFLNEEKNLVLAKETTLNNPYPQSLNDQQRQFNVLSEFDGRHNLAKIRAKTLICFGTQDLLSLPYESEYLQKNIANARALAFDCGHAIMMEVPQELTSALFDFLKSGVSDTLF